MPHGAWSYGAVGPDGQSMSDRRGQPDPRLRQFGVRLRQLREERDLTREQLAEAASVGVRQLARVEAGRASPSLVWLMDVAVALQLTPAALLEGS